jgi:hypothetical protein
MLNRLNKHCLVSMLIEHILDDREFQSRTLLRVCEGYDEHYLNVFEFVTIFVVKDQNIKRFLAGQLNRCSDEDVPAITYPDSSGVLSRIIKGVRISHNKHRTWVDDDIAPNVADEHGIFLKRNGFSMFPCPHGYSTSYTSTRTGRYREMCRYMRQYSGYVIGITNGKSTIS